MTNSFWSAEAELEWVLLQTGTKTLGQCFVGQQNKQSKQECTTMQIAFALVGETQVCWEQNQFWKHFYQLHFWAENTKIDCLQLTTINLSTDRFFCCKILYMCVYFFIGYEYMGSNLREIFEICIQFAVSPFGKWKTVNIYNKMTARFTPSVTVKVVPASPLKCGRLDLRN